MAAKSEVGVRFMTEKMLYISNDMFNISCLDTLV